MNEILFIMYCAGFLATYGIFLRKSWVVEIKSSAKSGRTKKVIKEPSGDDYVAAFFAGVFWPFFWFFYILHDIGYWVKPKEIKRVERDLEIEKMEREQLDD